MISIIMLSAPVLVFISSFAIGTVIRKSGEPSKHELCLQSIEQLESELGID